MVVDYERLGLRVENSTCADVMQCKRESDIRNKPKLKVVEQNL